MKWLYSLLVLGIMALVAVAAYLTSMLMGLSVRELEPPGIEAERKIRDSKPAVAEMIIEVGPELLEPESKTDTATGDMKEEVSDEDFADVRGGDARGDDSDEIPLDELEPPEPSFGKQVIVEGSELYPAKHQLIQRPDRGVFLIQAGTTPLVLRQTQ